MKASKIYSFVFVFVVLLAGCSEKPTDNAQSNSKNEEEALQNEIKEGNEIPSLIQNYKDYPILKGTDFNNGYAVATFAKGGEETYAVIDKTGEIVFNFPDYSEVTRNSSNVFIPFNGDYCGILTETRYMTFNKNGEKCFDYSGAFDFLAVGDNLEIAVLEKNGEDNYLLKFYSPDGEEITPVGTTSVALTEVSGYIKLFGQFGYAGDGLFYFIPQAVQENDYKVIPEFYNPSKGLIFHGEEVELGSGKTYYWHEPGEKLFYGLNEELEPLYIDNEGNLSKGIAFPREINGKPLNNKEEYTEPGRLSKDIGWLNEDRIIITTGIEDEFKIYNSSDGSIIPISIPIGYEMEFRTTTSDMIPDYLSRINNTISALAFEDGYFVFYVYNESISEYCAMVVDKSGNLLFDPERVTINSLEPFSEDLLVISNFPYAKVYNTEGIIVFQIDGEKYKGLSSFSDGLAMTTDKNGNIVYIDTNGVPSVLTVKEPLSEE